MMARITIIADVPRPTHLPTFQPSIVPSLSGPKARLPRAHEQRIEGHDLVVGEWRAGGSGVHAAQDAARSPARGPGTHRNKARLRAGRVRHLHGAAGWNTGAVVPGAGPRVRRSRRAHGRRNGAGWQAPSAARD